MYKTHELFDTTTIETSFSIAISNLEKSEREIRAKGFVTEKLKKLIDNVKSVQYDYLLKFSYINDLITDSNEHINSYNKILSVNEDAYRKNAAYINDAYKLIDDNFNRALAFKILKDKLSNFSITTHPASISKDGKYLFATYYDIDSDISGEIVRRITGTLTYASDALDVEIKRYLDGDDKRKLKSNYNSLGDGLREMTKGDYFKSKQSFYEIVNDSIDFKTIIKTSNILKQQVDEGNLIDLNDASMGMKSVAYLNMLFELEDKILVFDQPEDNIDNDYISNHLVPIIKSNKKIKQLIFVTHNPSVAVYGDAFNYIYTENEDEIKYSNYYIENINDKEKLLKILEGGRTSFSTRNKKYGDIIGDEQYGN